MSEMTAMAEDLAFLRRVAGEGQKLTRICGEQLALWGSLIPAALLINYFGILHELGIPNEYSWGFTVAGWLGSLTLLTRARVSGTGRSPISRIFTVTWVATGISLTALGLAASFGAAQSDATTAVADAAVLGVSFAITGLLTRLGWLYLVAIGWWVACLSLVYATGSPQLALILAGLYFGLLGLPGYILILAQMRAAT